MAAQKNKQAGVVALAGRLKTDNRARNAAKKLAALLRRRAAAKVVVAGEDGEALRGADLAVTLGGDGAFIQTARHAAPLGVPLTGVNLGYLGFLTDTPAARAGAMILPIVDGEYATERRMMIAASVSRGGRNVVRGAVAANDIVVSRGEAGVLLRLEVFIDGRLAYRQRSDGLIIATPAGSTAYAMSAGGPIVAPDLAAFSLVPLCPHALTHRPLLVSAARRLSVRIAEQKNARLHIDGQEDFALAAGDVITVRRHARPLIIRHPRGYDYFEVLRKKLRWGGE